MASTHLTECWDRNAALPRSKSQNTKAKRELDNSSNAMAKWIGKIKGEFEETQSVYADTKEKAAELLSENAGDTIDRAAIGDLEVSDIVEVEE